MRHRLLHVVVAVVVPATHTEHEHVLVGRRGAMLDAGRLGVRLRPYDIGQQGEARTLHRGCEGPGNAQKFPIAVAVAQVHPDHGSRRKETPDAHEYPDESDEVLADCGFQTNLIVDAPGTTIRTGPGVETWYSVSPGSPSVL